MVVHSISSIRWAQQVHAAKDRLDASVARPPRPDDRQSFFLAAPAWDLVTLDTVASFLADFCAVCGLVVNSSSAKSNRNATGVSGCFCGGSADLVISAGAGAGFVVLLAGSAVACARFVATKSPRFDTVTFSGLLGDAGLSAAGILAGAAAAPAAVVTAAAGLVLLAGAVCTGSG